MRTVDLIDTLGVDIDPHLDRDLFVPLETDRPSPQGDVLFVPADLDPHVNPSDGWEDVDRAGVVLVAGAHDHTLLCESGTVRWCPASDRSGNATHLIDASDGVAVIHHIEHAFRRLSGRWVVRRQQEGSQERRRMVAD